MIRIRRSRESGNPGAACSRQVALEPRFREGDDKLLKLAYSPAEQPRFDWMETIVAARQELSDKLTPTLRREVEGTLEKLYGDARRRATIGLRRDGEADAAERLPTACPHSCDQICQQDWYPASSEP